MRDSHGTTFPNGPVSIVEAGKEGTPQTQGRTILTENMIVAVRTDDGLFRDGLVGILLREESIFVVDDGADAGGLTADVILLDGRLSNALGICTGLTRASGTAVVFVAAPDDDEWAREALAAGARGILPRSARAEAMISALQVVDDGLIWASRRVMVAAIDQLTRTKQRLQESLLDKRLSAREREVFHHAATGLANKELADRLAISEATVKVHLTHIFQKLGLSSRAELAAAYHGVLHAGVQRSTTT